MNATTISRLEQLYPKLKLKAQQMIQMLALKGIDVEVAQGLRSWAEQEMLYAQGRTSTGRIITNATPDKSWHTYGCAFDVDIVAGARLDWTGNSPAWLAAIGAGESLGLVAGAEWRTFPDKPHFQLTGPFPVTPNADVFALYSSGGLAAVWSALDTFYASQSNHDSVQEAVAADN